MTGHALLSNDDGVFAPGLRALADAFLRDGWRVTVSAPDQERSAASHGLTIKRPVVVSPVTWNGVPEGAPLAVWQTDGLPADCAKIGLLRLCETRPDVVVSGINNGWNAGTDVHYSGTVAAAMEGAIEGVPGIAVSAMHPGADHYACAAGYAVKAARRLLKIPIPMPGILNINVPKCAPGAIQGYVEAPLACVQYSDNYDRLDNIKNRTAYWLNGEILETFCDKDTDLDLLSRGYATITLLGWDLGLPGRCGDFLQE